LYLKVLYVCVYIYYISLIPKFISGKKSDFFFIKKLSANMQYFVCQLLRSSLVRARQLSANNLTFSMRLLPAKRNKQHKLLLSKSS